DIGRLDIAVDDRVLVRVTESVGDRHQDLDSAGDGDLLGPFDDLVQVLPGQELLDDERDPVLDSEVVNGGDVAVVKIAGQLRLPEKAALDLLVIELAGFNRDRSFDEGIATSVDRAESADADLVEDLVFSDLLG